MKEPHIDTLNYLSHLVPAKKNLDLPAETLNEIRETKTKYEKLIALLEVNGQLDLIPDIKQLLTKLLTTERFLEEKQKQLNDEHYKHIQEQNIATLTTMLEKLLEESKKEMALFFKRTEKSFADLIRSLESRLPLLQQQLATTLTEFRDNSEAIYENKKQSLDVEEQIAVNKQTTFKAEDDVAGELEREWLAYEQEEPALLAAPKPGFQTIVRACTQEETNHRSNPAILLSRILSELRSSLLAREEKTQALGQLDSQKAGVEATLAWLDKLELRLRERLSASPNLSNIFTIMSDLSGLRGLQNKLLQQLQPLKEKEEALQHQIKNLSEEIHLVNQGIQDLYEIQLSPELRTKGKLLSKPVFSPE